MKIFKQLCVVAIVALALSIIFRHVVEAQTVVPPITIQSAQPHTACVVVAATTSYCFASDGLWQSLNGGAYTQLGLSGVASFNGRTGAVVSVQGDYSYSQLSTPPTTINCSATGCVIK